MFSKTEWKEANLEEVKAACPPWRQEVEELNETHFAIMSAGEDVGVYITFPRELPVGCDGKIIIPGIDTHAEDYDDRLHKRLGLSANDTAVVVLSGEILPKYTKDGKFALNLLPPDEAPVLLLAIGWNECSEEYDTKAKQLAKDIHALVARHYCFNDESSSHGVDYWVVPADNPLVHLIRQEIIDDYAKKLLGEVADARGYQKKIQDVLAASEIGEYVLCYGYHGNYMDVLLNARDEDGVRVYIPCDESGLDFARQLSTKKGLRSYILKRYANN